MTKLRVLSIALVLAIAFAVQLNSPLPALAVCQTFVSPKWPYTPHTALVVNYHWGANLTTPGTPWRNAFEASASDWNNSYTAIAYSYSAGSASYFDLYYEENNFSGKTPQYTDSNGLLYKVIPMGNTYNNPSTENIRRGVTGHELGHGAGLGHICASEGVALMGWNPSPDSIYYPQATDERLSQEVYPWP